MSRRATPLIVLLLLAVGAPSPIKNQEICVSSVSCPSCTFHAPGSPTLYVAGRNDGAGSTLINLVEAAAFAFHSGWNFGGTITCHNREKHHFSLDEAFDFMFGAGIILLDTVEADFSSGRSENDNDACRTEQLFALSSTGAFVLRPGGNVTAVRVPSGGAPEGVASSAWFTPRFVQRLRQRVGCRAAALLRSPGALKLQPPPTAGASIRGDDGHGVWGYFKEGPSVFKVAMHVRRGDVGAGNASRFDADGKA